MNLVSQQASLGSIITKITFQKGEDGSGRGVALHALAVGEKVSEKTLVCVEYVVSTLKLEYVVSTLKLFLGPMPTPSRFSDQG